MAEWRDDGMGGRVPGLRNPGGRWRDEQPPLLQHQKIYLMKISRVVCFLLFSL